MVRVRAASTWPIAASVIRNRNGISLIANPAIKVSPAGSWAMMRSGGRSKPVAHGETRRNIQPLGAKTKANPNATVTWGTDSSGDNRRWTRAKPRVPCHPAQNRITTANATNVVANPLTKERRTDSARPGAAHSWRHGSKVKDSPPSAGKYPSAGNKVPIKPAATGPRNKNSVTSGTARSAELRRRAQSASLVVISLIFMPPRSKHQRAQGDIKAEQQQGDEQGLAEPRLRQLSAKARTQAHTKQRGQGRNRRYSADFHIHSAVAG